MHFTHVDSLKARKAADIILIPFWKGKKKVELAGDFDFLSPEMDHALKTHDFLGKEGEILILYGKGQPEPRIGLVGLGTQDKITVEKLRRTYAQAAKACRSKKSKNLNVILPTTSSLTDESIVRGIADGFLLNNYFFDALKRDSLEENKEVLLEKVVFFGGNKKNLAVAQKQNTICQAVYMARDLVNGNADDVTPQYLGKIAQGLAKKYPRIKTTVFDKKRIEKEKMGLLLAVNRASFRDPAFIIVEYKGKAKSTENTVLVGKGITFDTGGLNLKIGGGMENMRDDMAGAAAVLGTIQAAAELGLPQNITGIIPSTENSIGSNSFKPGDVYISYAGKSVEIGDTDAEGRLVLADALAYAVHKLKPTRMIDLATLTGSVGIALGNEVTGFLSNNDALADSLIRAGSETFERLWRLPLYDEYKEQLKSDIADIKNIGGRLAGCITGGMFLYEFVKKIPWAHLDIGSTAFLPGEKRYNPKYATGIGVRLLIEFLENL